MSRPLLILDTMKNIAFFGYRINNVCYLGILVYEFGFIPVSKSLNLFTLFREESLRTHYLGWWVNLLTPTYCWTANDRKLKFYKLVANYKWFWKIEKKIWLTCLIVQLGRHDYTISAKFRSKNALHKNPYIFERKSGKVFLFVLHES